MSTDANKANTTSRPKRRWFRFSLRTFLLIFTLLCIWLGWKINNAREQKIAVANIKSHGGRVVYDYQAGHPDAKPSWLANIFGVDLFHDVVELDIIPGTTHERIHEVLPQIGALHKLKRVSMDHCLVEEDLQYLAPLRELKSLDLSDNWITGVGFSSLNNLMQLNTIYLGMSEINDRGLEVVAKLRSVKVLGLSKTEITDAGVQFLEDMPFLYNVDLSFTRITDASAEMLAKLPSLRFVQLTNTKMTSTGIQHLQSLRPNLKIQFVR